MVRRGDVRNPIPVVVANCHRNRVPAWIVSGSSCEGPVAIAECGEQPVPTVSRDHGVQISIPIKICQNHLIGIICTTVVFLSCLEGSIPASNEHINFRIPGGDKVQLPVPIQITTSEATTLCGTSVGGAGLKNSVAPEQHAHGRATIVGDSNVQLSVLIEIPEHYSLWIASDGISDTGLKRSISISKSDIYCSRTIVWNHEILKPVMVQISSSENKRIAEPCEIGSNSKTSRAIA